MKKGLGFVISYIYIGRYFSNFVLSLNGSGRVRVRAEVFPKPGPDPDPLQVFFLKPKPDPICYRTGYPRIGHKLPSLVAFNLCSFPRNATDKADLAQFPTPSATIRSEDPREGAPRVLKRQRTPRE